MRRLLVVLGLAASGVPLALGSTNVASAAPVQAAPAAVADPFTAGGSVEQVYSHGHAAGAPVELLDGSGTVIDQGVADTAGAKLFREVPPGGGYEVRTAAGSVGPLTVTSPDEHPSDAWYAEQAAAAPLAAGYGYVETRDGTDLSVNVTFPIDAGPGPWPVLVNYSGYDPSQPGGAPQEAATYPFQGYVVVGVNMRGTGCSGGTFEFMEDLQALDGYDVIENLAHQPWSNGDVGMVGISYSGYSQLYVAATHPPHLDAIAPLSPYSDTYSAILYPGGILNNGFAYEWATERENNAKPSARPWVRTRISQGDTRCAANQVSRLQAKPLLERIRSTPFADHEFDYLNTETFVDRIEVPTFLASQWQDEQTGGSAANLVPLFAPTTKVFASFTNGVHVEPMSPVEIYESMVFIDLYVGKRVPKISPYLYLGGPTVLADLFQAPVTPDWNLPANEYAGYGTHAAALAAYEAQPRVRIRWENGAKPGAEGLPVAQALTRHDNWPVDATIAEKIYLQPDGAATAAPSTVPDRAARARSSYVYDPTTKRPKTSDGGTNSQWAPHPDVHWEVLDEGASLSFTTAPYAAPAAYAGQGSADLWIRSSAADTDLEVTLTEVRPDGQEVYIQSGWLRASHRTLDPARSTELVPYHDHQAVDASPLPAGTFTPVRIEIFPFAHVIRAGSQLRINVEAPGGNQPFWAFESLPGTAVNEVGHSVGHPSRVVLPRLPADEAPTLPSALPACSLPTVTTQSVSLRNQPCRTYQPARTPTGVTASAAGLDLAVSWTAPAGAAPTAYRVVPSLGADAPAGAVAPAPVEVPGTATSARFTTPADGVPLEVRVQAVYDGVAAPASSASLPVTLAFDVRRLFGSWEAFVTRQLTDLAGSAPAATVRLGVAAIEAGRTPEAYVAGLRRANDARNNVDPVLRLYRGALRRSPNTGDVAYWAGRRRAGMSVTTIAQAVATSPEFVKAQGKLSNRAFVERIHLLVIGTKAPRSTVDLLTAALDRRITNRGGVLAAFTETRVHQLAATSWVDTVHLHTALLGRIPTAAELAATTRRLDGGTPLATVVRDLLASPAYRARIG